MGDDMLIAEQGRNISGGQQQIIGLARALIGDPPIIVMDEPTNGMDSKLEAFFMENVKKIVANKTFILITHKASQLVLVDRVILLDKGKIVIDDSKNKVSELLKNK
jgi:ATP-binding cassette subfamily C protein LapB